MKPSITKSQAVQRVKHQLGWTTKEEWASRSFEARWEAVEMFDDIKDEQCADWINPFEALAQAGE